ncbi:hypothetical protein [Providencia sp.]|uniref:hypothetical protein n=1 Tax=Providencia sp. TaxID=589 RepID=UPI003F9AFB0A
MKNITDVLSLISSIMTIMGITGLLSWGLSDRPKGAANFGLYILALMFRAAICILTLSFFTWPFIALKLFLVVTLPGGPVSVGGSSIEDPLFWWDINYPFIYLLSYIISIPIILVIAVPIIASIWSWSLKPFKPMYELIIKKNKNE